MTERRIRKAWAVTLLVVVLLTLGFRAFLRWDLGRDQLCGAAYDGDLATMRFLLIAGADPSRVGWEEHFTPLGEAVRNGQVEAARLLLAWGADPNVPNDHGWGDTAAQTLGGDGGPKQREVVALIRRAGGR